MAPTLSHQGPVNPAAPASFTLFQKLPVELRTRIWAHALPPPRIIPVGQIYWEGLQHSIRPFHGPGTYRGLPTLLSVNQESREETLRRYTLWVMYQNGTPAPVTLSNIGKAGLPLCFREQGYMHPGLFDFSRDSVFINTDGNKPSEYIRFDTVVKGIKLPHGATQGPRTVYFHYPQFSLSPRSQDGRLKRLRPFAKLVFRLKSVRRVGLILHNFAGRLYDGGILDQEDSRCHIPLKPIVVEEAKNGTDDFAEKHGSFWRREMWADSAGTYDATAIPTFQQVLQQVSLKYPGVTVPEVFFGSEITSTYNPFTGVYLDSDDESPDPDDCVPLPTWARPPNNIFPR